MLFKFRIYDKHKKYSMDENGEISISPLNNDTEWHKFPFILDSDLVRITAFRGEVLFDDDNNPTECTMVYLSDGSILFAVNKIDTFEANYIDFQTKLTTLDLQENEKPAKDDI